METIMNTELNILKEMFRITGSSFNPLIDEDTNLYNDFLVELKMFNNEVYTLNYSSLKELMNNSKRNMKRTNFFISKSSTTNFEDNSTNYRYALTFSDFNGVVKYIEVEYISNLKKLYIRELGYYNKNESNKHYVFRCDRLYKSLVSYFSIINEENYHAIESRQRYTNSDESKRLILDTRFSPNDSSILTHQSLRFSASRKISDKFETHNLKYNVDNKSSKLSINYLEDNKPKIIFSDTKYSISDVFNNWLIQNHINDITEKFESNFVININDIISVYINDIILMGKTLDKNDELLSYLSYVAFEDEKYKGQR